jgi:Caspase domain
MKSINRLLLLFTLLLSIKSMAQSPELRVPATHEASKFAFSKDDKMMVSLGQNEIKVWHTEGPYLLKSIPLPGSDTSYNTHLYITPDNKKVIVNLNGRVKMLYLETFTWDKSEWKIKEPRMEGISQDGKSLYYFLLNKKGVATLFKLDLATGKSVKLTDFTPEDAGYFGGDLCINHDESLLLSSSEYGGVVVDLKTNKVLQVLKDPQWALFFNEAGNLITSSQIKTGNSDKDTYGTNRKFKVEEIEPRTMKVLRGMTVTTKSDDIPEYNGIIWISHNNRDKILYEINQRFYIVNTNDFTQSKRQQVAFDIESFSSGSAMLSGGGKFAFWSNYMTAFKTDDVKKPYQFGISPYQPFMLSDASKGDELKALAGNRIISFEPRGLSFTQLPKAPYFDFHSTYRYVPSQQRLFIEGVEFNSGEGYGSGFVYDIKDDISQISPLQVSKDWAYDVVAIREYDILNTIVLLGDDRFFLMDTRTLKVKQQVLYGDDFRLSVNIQQFNDDHICALSIDKTKLVVRLSKMDAQDDNSHIVCYDVVNKSMLWKYESDAILSNPVYMEGDEKMRFFTNKKTCITLDAQTGKVLSSTTLVPQADHNSFFSPTQKYVLNKAFKETSFYGGISNYEVYDAVSKKLVLALPQQRVAYQGAIFMSNDRFLLTQDEDMKLWDLANGKLLARIITFQNSNDWIMLTPDGRFDGSQGGLEQLYYVKGQDVIPLEQLYEGFYTPGLTKQILAGTSAEINRDIKNIKSPPAVKLTYEPSKKLKELILDDMVMEVTVDKPNIQITADATCSDCTIAEIRLYHNGKLAGNTTRNLVVEDESSNTEKKVFDIELVEGENRLKVIAINDQRTESKPDEIIFHLKSAVKPASNAIESSGITMHLLVVGINKYKNSKYNLNYANADATSFKEAIENGGTSIFSKTNVVFIADEKATKEGISAELVKIKNKATAKDVFIFYYAGHGVLNEKKDFYLVPHDVTQLYGADEALAKNGLSALQLQEFSKDIKAQKQLFILDACQSAGALETVIAARGAAEEKAIAQLARATGTHWLTASGSEQFASEFSQLGHGAFTYVLLQALSGKADLGGDKKITVKELDAYLQEQVPEVTARYKGTPQWPSSYGFGNDFPIGVVKN